MTELEKELRALVRYSEKAISFAIAYAKLEDKADGAMYEEAIKAEECRVKLLRMLDKPLDKGKFRQMTLEECIKNEKLNKKS